MANKVHLREKRAKLIQEIAATLLGANYQETLVGRVVREAGGKEPIPQGRPGPGLCYVTSCDGKVTIERE